MVPLLDGSSDIGAHVRSNLYNLICLRHLNRSRIVTNLLFSEKTYYTLCVRCPELPSDSSTVGLRILCPYKEQIMNNFGSDILFHIPHILYIGVKGLFSPRWLLLFLKRFSSHCTVRLRCCLRRDRVFLNPFKRFKSVC